ncbi:phosphonoacetaldehyde reductase [Vibrio coralliirubri]|uniref:phosphonoacetaldehyde reductase n=1 Tax=Vibrio coralliirubri TaxID=1516159 RepID=UPI0006363CE3|nr:phosphonoacetaldehyde reductase [Vibrio coralliirubri]CDT09158.1 Alcohol dehydrogenase [Vibrio coralliirubri]CDT77477.1 Alcohol dehydrogenase [Vibrio coralliirubri]CDT79063.1 Alcohol dehydrogenase [Vibrio coralliirubri]
MWNFQNPVEIISGNDALNSLRNRINERSYSIVTYDNDVFKEYTQEVIQAIGHQPNQIIDGVVENPHFDNLTQLCKQLGKQETKTEVFVALGGGSVMDTTKVLAASSGDFNNIADYLTGQIDADALTYQEIIAIPTTAGTGSEVTHWGTIWDPENDAKYSLADQRLYPTAAIVHAPFTAKLPVSITVSTGLDALSHALESLWNKNRNPISAVFAVTASKAIIAILPELVKQPTNLTLRTKMQEASLMAGLAFSNTKTSIAHNMSYAVTLDKGTPHGIACSFTLPTIIRSIDTSDLELIHYLESIFNSNIEQAANQMEQFLEALNIETDPISYGYSKQQWHQLVEQASQGQRGKNFSGNIKQLIANFN